MKRLALVIFAVVLVTGCGAPGQGSGEPGSSNAQSSSDIVEAFAAQGLEIGDPYPIDDDPEWTSNLVPKTYIEGTHFDAAEDQGGGQVLIFENRRDLEVMKDYWEGFNEKGGFFYSHVYEKGNAILHINGRLPKTKAEEYNKVFQGM